MHKLLARGSQNFAAIGCDQYSIFNPNTSKTVDVRTWLDGDPAGPPPPKSRLHGRNKDWTQLYNDDIISMPHKW